MIVTTIMNTNRNKNIFLNRRPKMRLREKLFILFIAVVVTIVGFNLIASPAVHLLQESKAAGYEWINGYII